MLRVGAPGAMDEDARCVCCRVGSCAPGSTSSTSWYSSAIASSAAARWCCRMLSCMPQTNSIRNAQQRRLEAHVCHIRSHPSQMSSWSSLSALWQNSQPQSSSSSSFSSSHARCPLEDASAVSSLREAPPRRNKMDQRRPLHMRRRFGSKGNCCSVATICICTPSRTCGCRIEHCRTHQWLDEADTARRSRR